jgi:hypothetical protein
VKTTGIRSELGMTILIIILFCASVAVALQSEVHAEDFFFACFLYITVYLAMILSVA